MKVLIFAKEKPGFENAVTFIKLYTNDITIFQGNLNEHFPKEAYNQNPDILISYISPWIIPEKMLNLVKKWSINFHPGPPEYPGIGCTNFAIYNKEEIFGVTAHLMDTKVDSGKIIDVKRFPLLKEDTVLSLTERCYNYILIQFYEVIGYLFKTNKLPECKESWKRKPYTRKELNALCKIDINMDHNEIKRRIRATDYPGMPGAYIDLKGLKFKYAKK